MHRAGTSLVTQVLAQLGVFVGARNDENSEPLFFQQMNDWMLRQCGASWDNPSAFLRVFRDAETRSLIEMYIGDLVASPRIASFMGFGRYARFRGLKDFHPPWGWKDPRNTFTLPIWLDIFPSARVIHVVRHGVDVARSLVARDVTERARARQTYLLRKKVYLVRPKRGGFGGSVRCASLEGAFSLWEEYTQRGSQMVQELGERALEVRYEELLFRPKEQVMRLADFINVTAHQRAIDALLPSIQPRRAFGYKSERTLQDLAQSLSARLRLYGYSA